MDVGFGLGPINAVPAPQPPAVNPEVNETDGYKPLNSTIAQSNEAANQAYYDSQMLKPWNKELSIIWF